MLTTVTPPAETTTLARLAADRRHFEAVVQRRYAGVLTREDAEDVVSEALIASADRCPADDPAAARAWFTRVALNRAEDFRRARDGRPRSARGRNATGPATCRRLVPLDECPEIREAAADAADPAHATEQRHEVAEVGASVATVLASMDPQLAAVLRLRHMADHGEGLSRPRAAAALGIPVWRYERLYTRAREAFAEAMVRLAPTRHCRSARATLADAAAQGTHAARFASAHAAGCTSCAAALAIGGGATAAA